MPKLDAATLCADVCSHEQGRRHRAKLVLGGLRSNADIDVSALVEALRSPEEDVVFWASIAIQRLGTRAESSIPNLVALLSHDSLAVRQTAVDALARVGPRDPRARAAIFAAFRDHDSAVRTQALRTCIGLPDLSPDELTAIAGMAADSDPTVARWSETALRNIRLRSQPAAPAASAPAAPNGAEQSSAPGELDADAFTLALGCALRRPAPFPQAMRSMLGWCAAGLPHPDWKKVSRLDFAADLKMARNWIPNLLEKTKCPFEIRGLYFGLMEMDNPRGEEFATLEVAFLGQYEPADPELLWAAGEKRHEPKNAALPVGALKAAGLIFNRASGGGLGNDGNYLFCLSYTLLLIRALMTPQLYAALGTHAVKVGLVGGWDSGDLFRPGELTRQGFVPNRKSIG